MSGQAMRLVNGFDGVSQKLVYSYRGHEITRTYRNHDGRNKTHKGYWWSVAFLSGQGMHGLSRRMDAKDAIDRYETALAKATSTASRAGKGETT